MAEGIELLRCYVADRSEAAFAALVQQHLSLVYHAALRRTNGDVHLAEEVAQTVFANLAREAGSLQHHAVLTGWLYVATRHAAANAMRSELRRKTREREAHTMNEPTAGEMSDAEWTQLRPEIDSVMDELNEADRNAVLLRYFENRPYAEIGASFRITEDAARMRVDRALEKLRTLLARRGITSTAAALGGLLAAQSAVAAPAGLATAVAGSALAGAGVGLTASGTSGFIAFMTTNKIVMGIAAAVALGAGGTAVYEFAEARQAEAALIGMNRDIAELRSRLASKEAEVLAAEEKRRMAETGAAGKALSEVDAAKSRAQEAASAKGGAASKQTSASWAAKYDVLYANPEYVQLELERWALGMRQQYGTLYRRLGLTDRQIREFESLMLEKQQAFVDVFAAARAQGVSVNDPSLRQLNDPIQEAVKGKLKALLGTEGYDALTAFTGYQASTARSAVGNLAMRVYDTAPLTTDQADRLTEIIAAHTPEPARGTGFIMDNGKTDWAAIYAQAKDLLSPIQLAALQAANRSLEISIEQSQLSDKLLQEAAKTAAK